MSSPLNARNPLRNANATESETFDAVVRILGRDQADIRPNDAFKSNLRSNLISADAATIRAAHGSGIQINRPRSITTVGGRWLAIAATVALLLTTVAGAWIGLNRDSANDGQTPGFAALASPEATALPDGRGYCDRVAPSAPCAGQGEVGLAYVRFYDSSDEAKAVTQVELQRWTIPANGEVVRSIEPKEVAGFAIDFVNDGLYQATFFAPVAVMRQEATELFQIEYLEAGTLVELGQGDSVTYPIDTRDRVVNGSDHGDLVIRTAFLHSGDISAGNLMQLSNATSETIGTAILAKPLSDYYVGDVFLSLNYITEPLDLGAGTYERDPYVYILGPVDYQDWSESGQGGFVLWLVIPRG